MTAERDVADGWERVQRQAAFVARLRDAGQDVRHAEAFLASLIQTLECWQDHRDEGLQTIARLEAGPEP